MEYPSTYGGYTLLAELGEGGMAQVFLARKIGPGGFAKLQVIKRILPSLGREPEFVQMFLDEARLAARFEHPNVVQVYDLGEAQGALYLAMEYLAGQSVAALAKEAVKREVPVPPAISAHIVAEACEGLHYVHDFKELDGTPLNIVHRDVSPQNLFVTYEGRVKLLDFGVAKAASTVVKTRTGSVKGKISYMAPEQCRGETVDRRADIFAAGIVLLELIAGKRVFRSDNEFALIRQLSTGEFQRPSQMGFIHAPQPLLAICDRAMAFHRDERYATCAELKADLLRWLATAPPSGPNELAELMGRLFKEDIALRQQVLLAKDDTAEVFQRVKQETSGTSLPSLGRLALEQATVTRDPVSGAAPATAPGARWLVAALLGALAAGGGAVSYLWAKREPVIVVVPAPPVPRADAGAAAQVEPPAPEAQAPDAAGAVVPPVKKVPRPAARPATLIVKSALEGCSVVVDLAARGTAPVKVAVEPGTHEVRVACAGYAVDIRSTTLAPAEHVTVDVDPRPLGKGTLTLKTTPWSVVFEGDRELGMTPLINLELPAGQHTLRAVNTEQQLEKTFTVTVKAGDRATKTVDLTGP